MNAHDLSKITKVPYSRIYEVLNEMIKKSIITKLDGRPSTFISNNPAEVFAKIKKYQEIEFESNMGNSLPILKQLYGEKSVAKQEVFSIYEGNRPATDFYRDVLNGTNTSIFAVVKNMYEIFPYIKMNLDFLKAKGIKGKLIIEERFRDKSFIQTLHKYGEIKFYPEINSGICISDEKIGIQLIKGAFNIAKPRENEYAIISSTCPTYIIFLMEQFNRYWEKAIE